MSIPGTTIWCMNKGNWCRRHVTRFVSTTGTCIAIVCLCFPVMISAQQVSATTDRTKILIGEQVELTLKLSDMNPATTSLVQWFTLNDSSSHLITVQRNPVDTVELNGLVTYIEKYRITSFDSGKWTLPPLRVALQYRGKDSPEWVNADSITIEVLPVNVEDLASYHPVKEILDVEVKTDYVLYGAIAASILLLLYLIWKLTRKRNMVQQPEIRYKPDALMHAIQQIASLTQQYQSKQLHVKGYYSAISAISRDYFQQQLNLRSAQSTSDELMVLLGVYLQQEAKRTEFYQLLRLTDAVKFACYIPTTEQDTAAAASAVSCLQHIDSLLKAIQHNPGITPFSMHNRN